MPLAHQYSMKEFDPRGDPAQGHDGEGPPHHDKSVIGHGRPAFSGETRRFPRLQEPPGDDLASATNARADRRPNEPVFTV